MIGDLLRFRLRTYIFCIFLVCETKGMFFYFFLFDFWNWLVTDSLDWESSLHFGNFEYLFLESAKLIELVNIVILMQLGILAVLNELIVVYSDEGILLRLYI
mgnify:FL=1